MSKQLRSLSEADLKSVAAALRAGRLSSPFTSAALQRFVGNSRSTEVASELERLGQSGFTNETLAQTLELVAQDRCDRPSVEDIVDLVTTGPEARGVTNRDTSVVVRELFASAQKSVLVAGFAVYQGRVVFEALADRMLDQSELNVRLILDIQRAPGETTSTSELIRRFVDRFRRQQWPKDRPMPEVYFDPRSLELSNEKRTSMHAKSVIVDGQHVFISSANFTEAAQERNIEVGLLVHSATIASQLTHFFDAMLAENLLQQIL